MTFVTIGLLVAGAVSMAVPILIHMLSRQRRRPVRWAAMRFLIEAVRKYRRRIRLEQFLLLAVRCLILLVLGAALARPILDEAGVFDAGGLRVVMLVIDNGLLSGLRSPGPGDQEPATALDRSVERAVEVVGSLGPGDLVGVITAARPARGVVVPPSGDHGAVIELLESLEPGEAPADLPAALRLLGEVLAELPPDRDQTVAYLLSEFRRGAAPLDLTLPPIPAKGASGLTLLAAPPAQAAVSNIQVAGIDALRGLVLGQTGEGADQITVRLTRNGGELGREVTRVRLAGEHVPLVEAKTVRWDPGQLEARVDFAVDLGGHGEGSVALTSLIDADPLTPDNRRHLVLAARSQVRAVLLDRRRFGVDPNLDQLGAGQWIRRALQPSDRSPMDVIEVDPAALEAVDLRGADCAILARPDLLTDRGWSALRTFVDRGGLLLALPPGASNIHQWTERFVAEMRLPWQLALEVVEHPDAGLSLADDQPESELLRLISGELAVLSRPVVAWRVLPVDPQRTGARHVLAFADGSPMVIAGSPSAETGPEGSADAPSRGLVLYMAVSPELAWTNLPAKPLMVPLVHELVRQGVGLIRTARRYRVGEQPHLGIGPTAATLVDPEGSEITIADDGRPRRPMDRAGLYEVLDPAGQPVTTIAVNVDPASAIADPQPSAAVAEWLASSGDWQTFEPDDPARPLRSADSGSPMAGVLLWALLGLIVAETAFARWFSHAELHGAERFAAGGPAGGLEPASAGGGRIR